MFKHFNKLSYWFKSGLICGFLGAVIIAYIPDRYLDLSIMPDFLIWLVFPIFFIFTGLCLLFNIDFVSNYPANEGILRKVLLSLLFFISVFVVFFILGAIISVIVRFFIKKKIKSS